MRILEGTIKNLLQGVSQQIPTARNDGQLGASLNMQADPITSLRRRWGWRKIGNMPTVPLIYDNFMASIRTFQYDLGFERPRLISVNNEGVYFIWEIINDEPRVRATGNLVAHHQGSYSASILNGKLYILSAPTYASSEFVEPEEVNPDMQTLSHQYNPRNRGFFWVRSGAFSKKYEVRVTCGLSSGPREYTFSYTTPDGTNAGDADKSTSAYICKQLVDAINKAHYDDAGAIISGTPWVNHTKDGVAWVDGVSTADVVVGVETDAGSQYMSASGKMRVRLETDLPPWGHGTVSFDRDTPNYSTPVAVGANDEDCTYYRYDTNQDAWLETAGWEQTWYNAEPVMTVVSPDDSVGFLRFEGRLAGNESNNPTPPWLHDKAFQDGTRALDAITAMTTWQGRMLIASGGKVYCSAVGKPERFYRTTVTELVEADRLIIESGSQRTGSIKGMFQQDKDLVLLADDIQTLIPAPNTPLSYKNAMMHSISQFMCDSAIPAVQVGPTKMYWTMRNGNSIGGLELSSSQYTTSQYTTTDVTQHIPTLFRGRKMFAPVVLGTSNLIAVPYGSTSDEPTDMAVHEYMFSSEGKVQSAWHKWSFGVPVYGLFNYQDALYCMLKGVAGMDIYKLMPLAERTQVTELRSNEYSLDFWEMGALDKRDSGVSVSLHGGLARYIIAKNDFSSLRVMYSEGASTGRYIPIKEVQVQSDKASLRLIMDVEVVSDTMVSNVVVGLHIPSEFELTSPTLRDKDGNVIYKDAVRLLRLNPVMANTGEFSVRLQDKSRDIDFETEYTAVKTGGLGWDFSGDGTLEMSTVPIPCRVNTLSATATFKAFEGKPMTVLGVDFLLQRPNVRQRV